MSTSVSVILAERPKADIIPGTTFNHVSSPAPTADDLKEGEVLAETLYLSLDPAMRGWINGEYIVPSSPILCPQGPPPHPRLSSQAAQLRRILRAKHRGLG